MKFLMEDDRTGNEHDHAKCHVYIRSPFWKFWEKWTYLHTAMCHGDAADWCDDWASAHEKGVRHPDDTNPLEVYESRKIV
jgi:hypothetical protein